MVAVSALLFLSQVTGALACVPTLEPTTPAPVCCPPITTGNPPRRTPIPGSIGATLDQCSIFRRFTRGVCPTEAILVCSRAPGTTVSTVVLELSDGANVVASAQDPLTAALTITCMATGVWQYVPPSGVPVSFTQAHCSQNTLTSGDYTYDTQP